MGDIKLTHKQAVNRIRDIQEILERLAGKADKTREDYKVIPELMEEFRNLDEHRLELEQEEALNEVRGALGGGGTTTAAPEAKQYRNESGTAATPDEGQRDASARWSNVALGASGKYRKPWDLSQMRTFGRDRDSIDSEFRDRAYDAFERMPHATDKVREASAQLVEKGDTRTAQLALATTSPEYMGAFTKLMRNKAQVAVLSTEERDAYTRAMSLTDSAGGFLVPFQLDPTVILTANGSSNDVRKIARVVQATGDSWAGISSAGVTGSWDAEAAEVSDDSPTFAQPTIPNYKGQIFVPISLEARQDESNVAGEVARMIAFEKDRMESVAFVTGSGVGEPTGIVTALTGTASVINSTTTDTFAVGDVYALDSALPARWAANASWLGHRAIYNFTRRFDTNGGSSLWATLGEGLPQQLLGRPAYTAEAMDGSITALSANPVLIFGDFNQYVITDRIGTTLDYIPHLFGSNRRPTGQSGWFAYFRTGADSLVDPAFRMLDVT